MLVPSRVFLDFITPLVPSDTPATLLAALQEDYDVEHELGGGAMSRVFLARDPALGRQIVIKALPATAAGMDAERFRREILLSARLQHPHIVPVLAAGEAAGVPYFTMPYVAGQSLEARLPAGPPLAMRELVRIARDVDAAGLRARAGAPRGRARARPRSQLRERDPWLYTMSVNAPWFDPIPRDPRFAEVVRTMGLDVALITRPAESVAR